MTGNGASTSAILTNIHAPLLSKLIGELTPVGGTTLCLVS